MRTCVDSQALRIRFMTSSAASREQCWETTNSSPSDRVQITRHLFGDNVSMRNVLVRRQFTIALYSAGETGRTDCSTCLSPCGSTRRRRLRVSGGSEQFRITVIAKRTPVWGIQACSRRAWASHSTNLISSGTGFKCGNSRAGSSGGSRANIRLPPSRNATALSTHFPSGSTRVCQRVRPTSLGCCPTRLA